MPNNTKFLIPETKEDKKPSSNMENTKYDMVFIIGSGHLESDVLKITDAANKSGLKFCIIGDGKTGITEEYLARELLGNIDSNTQINIFGHGAIHQKKHNISIYQQSANIDFSTSSLLADLKNIYDADAANLETRMNVDIYSCNCGHIKNLIPQNVQAVLHSGKKYSTLTSMNVTSMVLDIENKSKNKLFKPYENFMAHMLSPETLIWSELDSANNLHTFKYAAPKKPLFTETELKKYLVSEIKRFIKFRKEIGHSIYDIYGVAKLPSWPGTQKFINKYIDDLISITPEKLIRYNELALIMECHRNNDTALLYAAKTSTNMQKNSINVNAHLANGLTPLHGAVTSNDKRLIKTLLANGADPYKAKRDGYTPLDYAAQNGNVGVVKIILDATRRNLPDDTAYKAINLAKDYNKTSCANLILSAHLVNIIFDNFNLNGKKFEDLEKLFKEKIYAHPTLCTDIINQRHFNPDNAVNIIWNAVAKEALLNLSPGNLNGSVLNQITEINLERAINNAAKTLMAPTKAPITTAATAQQSASAEIKMPMNSFVQRVMAQQTSQVAVAHYL